MFIGCCCAALKRYPKAAVTAPFMNFPPPATLPAPPTTADATVPPAKSPPSLCGSGNSSSIAGAASAPNPAASAPAPATSSHGDAGQTANYCMPGDVLGEHIRILKSRESLPCIETLLRLPNALTVAAAASQLSKPIRVCRFEPPSRGCLQQRRPRGANGQDKPGLSYRWLPLRFPRSGRCIGRSRGTVARWHERSASRSSPKKQLPLVSVYLRGLLRT